MERPQKNLYSFAGKAYIAKGLIDDDLNINLDINQFIHRGAKIQNSSEVLAMCIGTGVETKLHMNLIKYRFKVSHLEYYYNLIMVINVVLMLSMALLQTICFYNFTSDSRDKASYLFYDAPSNGILSGAAFFSFYLILNSFIPLEIPVMVELSKFMATYFLQRDAYMMQVNKVTKEADRLQV